MNSNFPKSVKDGVFLNAIESAIHQPGKHMVVPYDDLFVLIVARPQTQQGETVKFDMGLKS